MRKNDVQEIDMSPYRDLGLDGQQTREIHEGLEAGLDVSAYAKPEFTAEQMKQIREGLKAGLDVSTYAKPEYDAKQMEGFRKNLPFAESRYRDAIGRMVHFSTKTVNSNAREGGIRLTPEQQLNDLPYVSLRTMMRCIPEVDTDYTGNAAQMGPIAGHIASCKSDKPNPDFKATKQDIAMILGLYRESLSTRAEIGCEYVSPRLRQLLIPKPSEKTGYVAITPLRSAPFCAIVNKEAEKIRSLSKKDPKRFAFVKTAYLKFGGNNPQNIGRLVKYTQTPLLFQGPTENKNVKRAFSIFYNGIPIVPWKKDMDQYREWVVQKTHEGGKDGRKMNMKNRIEEAAIIGRIVRHILYTGDAARDVLIKSREYLPPSEGMVADSVSLVKRGVIDPELRTQAWAKQFCAEVARAILEFKFKAKGRREGETLDVDIAAIENWAMEALR